MSSIWRINCPNPASVPGSMQWADDSNNNTVMFGLVPAATSASGLSTVDMSGSGTILGPAGFVSYSKTIITSAQMLALSASPVTLLPAPGAGKFIKILDCLFYLNYNSIAYAAGSTLQVVENAVAVATTTAALINGSAAAVLQAAFPGFGTSASVGAANAAVTLGVSGANFTTGNSTVGVYLSYTTITL